MDFLIGSRQHFQEFRLNHSERAELMRMRDEQTIQEFYSFLLERINEYELSIINDNFKCELFNEQMSFNHVVCLLRRDVLEKCPVVASAGLVTKLVKIFLSALRDCCVGDGVVELDAKDVLARFQSGHQKFHHAQSDLQSAQG